MYQETSAPPPPTQISQVNPTSLREFLPDHVSGIFIVLESHFKNNNIRSRTSKFHILIEIIPPTLIVHFAHVIQKPSQNPYDDLKAAILQHTQPFAAEKVEKLLHQGCIGDLKPTALLKKMKLLAPGDSFDTDFRKLLYFKKLPFYIEPILANALNTEPIGSLADMADYIIETAGLPRTEEIPYSSHLAPTKSEPPTAWEEHMLKLEAKIGALHFRGANYAAAHSIDAGDLSPDTPQDPEDTKIKLIREMSHPSSSGGNYRNSGTSYLINSGAEISVIPSTPANRNSSDHPLILAAANDSPIKTYGQKSVTLDLGLRRTFRWIFTIADVSKPIIGADFLCHFGFLLDLCRKKLLDPLTGLHSKYTEYPCPTYCPITCIQSSESPLLLYS
ncbi:unnamed protein product [Hymenolepis diminuta]|uniref:DUF7041 domain-containing protein n=1 Tax=Hymenolepis diminuta TaxID=6216 RepID=A0A564YCC6_HYMDI|nr:unnamed protein product [Hymenolepis diminuta]